MTQDSDRQPVVLMVDDTPANLGVLFELLSESGFRVLVAEDGESALTRAEYACPDLILLDVMMPGIDGFTVCSRLKENPATMDIPVIFMTALTDTVDKVKGFHLGAVDYITKPFQDSEVLARVRTHITMQTLKTRLIESEERLSRIFESAMDAIITLDHDHRITLFNQAAEQAFRCQSTDVLGKPVSELLPRSLNQILQDYTRQVDTGRKQALWLPSGHTALRTDGEEFPIEATLSRVEVAGQSLYTFILRDISQREQQEAEQRRLRGMALYLDEEVRAAHEVDTVIGESAASRKVMDSARQVAATDATVLITGETGTGKEVIARTIHNLSPLKDRILVKLNCAAIPAGLVESELFGHEKGAFTGATARKVGRFELADGGTIFLDELGELPLDLQSKLLRVLQEGEFERVGGTQTLKVDVRVIAATNRDLAQLSQQGAFRADLYYRLNVFPIHLPPLRERKEDIAPLIKHFVQKYASKFNRGIEVIPERLMTALLNYAWPGNIRELQHVIERAVILSQGKELELGDWFRSPAGGSPLSAARILTLAEVERNHIIEVLELTGWRVSGKKGAAELLDMKPTTLESRMKKLGISRKR
jgi:PAS domain S-box-containing protein